MQASSSLPRVASRLLDHRWEGGVPRLRVVSFVDPRGVSGAVRRLEAPSPLLLSGQEGRVRQRCAFGAGGPPRHGLASREPGAQAPCFPPLGEPGDERELRNPAARLEVRFAPSARPRLPERSRSGARRPRSSASNPRTDGPACGAPSNARSRAGACERSGTSS